MLRSSPVSTSLMTSMNETNFRRLDVKKCFLVQCKKKSRIIRFTLYANFHKPSKRLYRCHEPFKGLGAEGFMKARVYEHNKCLLFWDLRRRVYYSTLKCRLHYDFSERVYGLCAYENIIESFFVQHSSNTNMFFYL